MLATLAVWTLGLCAFLTGVLLPGIVALTLAFLMGMCVVVISAWKASRGPSLRLVLVLSLGLLPVGINWFTITVVGCAGGRCF